MSAVRWRYVAPAEFRNIAMSGSTTDNAPAITTPATSTLAPRLRPARTRRTNAYAATKKRSPKRIFRRPVSSRVESIQTAPIATGRNVDHRIRLRAMRMTANTMAAPICHAATSDARMKPHWSSTGPVSP